MRRKGGGRHLKKGQPPVVGGPGRKIIPKWDRAGGGGGPLAGFLLIRTVVDLGLR